MNVALKAIPLATASFAAATATATAKPNSGPDIPKTDDRPFVVGVGVLFVANNQRWETSWWMVPAWPILLLLNAWFTFVGPLLFGPYLLADEFELKGVRNQVRKGASEVVFGSRGGRGIHVWVSWDADVWYE